MQMDEGLDTGDMLFKMSCPINKQDTGGSLHDRLAKLGAQAILQALEKLQAGSIVPEPQDNNLSTYARKLDKQEALINWQEDAQQIARQIRAFNPWPGSQTRVNDKTLRIWSAEPIDGHCDAKTGTVLNSSRKGIDICCGHGILRLQQLQPPGKKAMDVAAFINGYADLLAPGSVLG
jgi:methionyl-tRNA formyltransferase